MYRDSCLGGYPDANGIVNEDESMKDLITTLAFVAGMIVMMLITVNMVTI